jgi:hypothetical protein
MKTFIMFVIILLTIIINISINFIQICHKLLTIGTEAELLLRKTIIQAKLNERGNYGIF